ncbi:hypothetical protein DVP43_05800 [Yersinia enterocolitica]|nr:hypothetical protein [Yersinia enterocolitica]EKN5936307.1 hypothetical protein [Yersinia enterocolitica]EKN6052119.1 hypothetical protein [Yersinia enterocolitica]
MVIVGRISSCYATTKKGRYTRKRNALYPIDFKIQEGSNWESPAELTPVNDSGKREQPTHMQLEV